MKQLQLNKFEEFTANFKSSEDKANVNISFKEVSGRRQSKTRLQSAKQSHNSSKLDLHNRSNSFCKNVVNKSKLENIL